MTPDPENVADAERTEQLAAYLGSARWFGGKGRAFTVTSVTGLTLAPGVTTNLVGLTFADGGTDLYQVPLASYDEPVDRLPHALVGIWDGQHHYDAVHDRDAMAVWLRTFAGDPSPALSADVDFVRVSDHDLDLSTHSTLFSGEQSNSSLAFGEDSLLKVFRRVTPGLNPDIEIHQVLTDSGSTHVAALYGYASAGEHQLAMLQQFLRTASDGWGLALASARNLFTETDLLPEEAGGDFGAEAHRLGSTLAEIHEVLATTFGTEPFDAAATTAAMKDRLAAAVEVVPEIAEVARVLGARFDALAPVSAEVQRIHADLHLGQTLRTSLGWKLVDFEGEPAKPLAERRLPDSPWRDVAGMIRSFDYAAATVARDLAETDDEGAEVAHRAGSWTAHTTTAFLAGYTEQRGREMTDAEGLLLRAYIADKAVYETIYEARNRPGWIVIPLAALAGIAETPA